MIEIDKDTFKIKSSNYYKSKYKKRQIILAGSLRKENFHIKRFSKKEFGESKKWCTYSISREGKIFQHYNPKYYTDFMDIKDVDKHSISIVLENMGMVFYDGTREKFLNWLYEDCEEDNVYEKTWKSCRYWEKYTDKQMDATVELCKYLSSEFNIPLDSLGYNVFYEQTKDFEGIITRSNYSHDYNDLNPSFNFKTFLKKLNIWTE